MIEQGDLGSEMLVLVVVHQGKLFRARVSCQVPLLEPKNASEIKPSSNDSLSASSEGRGEAGQEEKLLELAGLELGYLCI